MTTVIVEKGDAGRKLNRLMNHPLISSSELIVTPPVAELYRSVKKTIVLCEPGCCICAPSGWGKTSTLELVAKMLRQDIPGIVVVEHNMKNQQSPSIRAFFKDFLDTVSHKEVRGETSDLRRRLTYKLIDDARQSGLNSVVLCIDEAQAMLLQDFLFLKDVYNSLGKEKVKLTTLMMGQSPDFEAVISRLREDARLDIIARFTMRKFLLRPLFSVGDLLCILEYIDSSVHPKGSKLTWTQFIFPQAYGSGFRMVNEMTGLMEALKKSEPLNDMKGAFPARPLFLAIKEFMIVNAEFDSPTMQLPPDSWDKSVLYAQMVEAMEYGGSKKNKHWPKVKL